MKLRGDTQKQCRSTFFFSSTVAENTLKPTSRSIVFFFFFSLTRSLLVSKVNLCGYEPDYSAIQPDRWSLSRHVNPRLDDFNPKVVSLFFPVVGQRNLSSVAVIIMGGGEKSSREFLSLRQGNSTGNSARSCGAGLLH